MVNLSSLPAELLRMITRLLTRKYLKVLRLMSRQLNSVVGGLLFRSILIHEGSGSMCQLKHIAESPIWSRQVQIIDWLLPMQVEEDGPHESEITLNVAKLYESFEYVRNLTSVRQVAFMNTSWTIDEGLRYEPGTLDLCDILRFANLKPSTIISHAILLRLEHSKEGNCTALHGEMPDLGYFADFDLSTLGSSVLQNRCYTEKGRVFYDYYANGLTCFGNLARDNKDYLQSLTLGETLIDFECFLTLINRCCLKQLTLEGTIFQSSSDEISLHDVTNPADGLLIKVLEAIAEGKTSKGTRFSFADLVDVWVHLFYGGFDASDAELTSWVENGQPDLGARAQATFKEGLWHSMEQGARSTVNSEDDATSSSSLAETDDDDGDTEHSSDEDSSDEGSSDEGSSGESSSDEDSSETE